MLSLFCKKIKKKMKTINIMIIGDSQTGKSTFINKFTNLNQLDYISEALNFYKMIYIDDENNIAKCKIRISQAKST